MSFASKATASNQLFCAHPACEKKPAMDIFYAREHAAIHAATEDGSPSRTCPAVFTSWDETRRHHQTTEGHLSGFRLSTFDDPDYDKMLKNWEKWTNKMSVKPISPQDLAELVAKLGPAGKKKLDAQVQSILRRKESNRKKLGERTLLKRQQNYKKIIRSIAEELSQLKTVATVDPVKAMGLLNEKRNRSARLLLEGEFSSLVELGSELQRGNSLFFKQNKSVRAEASKKDPPKELEEKSSSPEKELEVKSSSLEKELEESSSPEKELKEKSFPPEEIIREDQEENQEERMEESHQADQETVQVNGLFEFEDLRNEQPQEAIEEVGSQGMEEESQQNGESENPQVENEEAEPFQYPGYPEEEAADSAEYWENRRRERGGEEDPIEPSGESFQEAPAPEEDADEIIFVGIYKSEKAPTNDQIEKDEEPEIIYEAKREELKKDSLKEPSRGASRGVQYSAEASDDPAEEIELFYSRSESSRSSQKEVSPAGIAASLLHSCLASIESNGEPGTPRIERLGSVHSSRDSDRPNAYLDNLFNLVVTDDEAQATLLPAVEDPKIAALLKNGAFNPVELDIASFLASNGRKAHTAPPTPTGLEVFKKPRLPKRKPHTRPTTAREAKKPLLFGVETLLGRPSEEPARILTSQGTVAEVLVIHGEEPDGRKKRPRAPSRKRASNRHEKSATSGNQPADSGYLPEEEATPPPRKKRAYTRRQTPVRRHQTSIGDDQSLRDRQVALEIFREEGGGKRTRRNCVEETNNKMAAMVNESGEDPPKRRRGRGGWRGKPRTKKEDQPAPDHIEDIAREQEAELAEFARSLARSKSKSKFTVAPENSFDRFAAEWDKSSSEESREPTPPTSKSSTRSSKKLASTLGKAWELDGPERKRIPINHYYSPEPEKSKRRTTEDSNDSD